MQKSKFFILAIAMNLAAPFQAIASTTPTSNEATALLGGIASILIAGFAGLELATS
jgi:hypothetical protein